MSNPFAIGALNNFNPAQAASFNPNTNIGGSQVGGSIFSPQGAQGIGQPKIGGGNLQSELSEVSAIGAGKKAGFLNGVGGTNDPAAPYGQKLHLIA